MKSSIYLKIKKFIEKNSLLKYGDKVVAGVSGGADSVLLFLILAELSGEYGLELCAVHINHGIRGKDALRDEQFTVSFVNSIKQYRCYVFRENIPALAKRLKLTEEEAGRRYRYECFENIKKQLGFNKIAVAHHKDDQAETVLFQMLRGSGIKGLGGMKPCNGDIIRPLLGVRRTEIEEALASEGINYCTDYTNADCRYARNRIRNDILPYIAENIQPAVVERLAGTAKQLSDIHSYIEKQALKLYAEIVTEEKGACYADAALLAREDIVIQREILMYMAGYMAGGRKDITSKHIDMLAGLVTKGTGRCINLPYGLVASRDYNSIWIKKKVQIKENTASVLDKINICVPGSIELEYNNGEKHIIVFKREHIDLNAFPYIMEKNCCTKWFDYDKIKFMPQFRHPASGDYMWLCTGGSKKNLSRILIDSKVPANERAGLWVLAEGSHILWVPELGRCSAYYYVTDKTKEVLLAVCAAPGGMAGSMEGKIKMGEIIHEMITEKQITDKISQIASQINKDYEGKEVHLVCILKGGVFFCCELAKKITVPVTMDFMAVSSYRDDTKSSGRLSVTKDLDEPIDGRHCIVIEDIVDTGSTLALTKKMLLARNPASLKLCVFLDKPARRETEIEAEYTGFTIPDKFVAGYGLDYAQKYRNLPYIGEVEFVED